MTPRFITLEAAQSFAQYAEQASGAPCSVYNAKSAYLVRPEREVPLFWRLANAWGYLVATKVDN